MGTVLFDFSFVGDNTLLLVAHNGKRMLRLTDGLANPIMELPVGRKGELLYDDCLGHVHLFGKDSVYQIGLTSDSLWLAHAFASDIFLDKMGHCSTASDSHIFFSAYQKVGQEVNHYGLHRETREGVILARVRDKDEIRRAEEYFNRKSTPRYRWARNGSTGRYRMGDINNHGHCTGMRTTTSRMASPHCSTPTGGGRADRGRGGLGGGSLGRFVRRPVVRKPLFPSMEVYERSYPAHMFELEQLADGVWDTQPYERVWRRMMAPPTYSPMFSLRDSIYVFDHVLGLCEVFNRKGEPVRTFPIVHQGMRDWKRKLIPDADGQRVYARMERHSTLYLAEIDLNDGSALSTIRLPDAAHSDRLKVRNGHAYFMVRDTDLYTPDRLVRQRL